MEEGDWNKLIELDNMISLSDDWIYRILNFIIAWLS